MSYESRLQKAFEGAVRLPLNSFSKYVLFSDCHRGTGSSNDNFLKNQTLYTAALKYYLKAGYTYIELGDGDELWENRDMSQIIETHSTVFQLLSLFHRQCRLYLLYGNHDLIKKDYRYTSRCCSCYPCCCGSNTHLERQPLLPDARFYEGIILENAAQPLSMKEPRDIYLTHGHQADLFNSTFWRVSRFLVRYVWQPLEHFGVLDPTSAAKNYTRKEQTERRLHSYAKEKGIILITGHTHRPMLSEADLSYCNSGSCVHPYSITCLEIERMQISLIKWSLTAGADMRLSVAREVLAGPVPLG